MMEIFEKHKVGFVYLFECFDKNGKLKWREKIGNIIPDVGLDYLLEAALAGATRYAHGISAFPRLPMPRWLAMIWPPCLPQLRSARSTAEPPGKH